LENELKSERSLLEKITRNSDKKIQYEINSTKHEAVKAAYVVGIKTELSRPTRAQDGGRDTAR